MHPLETLAALAEWAGRNTVHNLQFIPEDRFDWKPAPTAKSAREVINHVSASLRSMIPVLRGGEWRAEQYSADTREEACDQLESCVALYTAALRQVPPESLARIVVAGRRQVTVTTARAAAMPVVDLIHHHGQIAYIQTLLGDEEFHFVEETT